MPTKDGQGYAKWDDFPISAGPRGQVSLTVDGYAIQGTILPYSIGWTSSRSSVLMADGTTAHQFPLPKPKQPITMDARAGSWGILIAWQEDFIRIQRAAQRAGPVLAFFGDPIEDQWRITNGDAGQTTWRTSRRIGWNGTTRTHATHPPYAEIDGVEQTIVTGGTPTTGEVKIPTAQTADQYYDTITTPALSSGEYLIVRYWPEYLMTLTINTDLAQHNDLRIGVTMAECLAGEY